MTMPTQPSVPRRRRLTVTIATVVAVLATGSGVGAYFLSREEPVKEPARVPAPIEIGVKAEEAKCTAPERPKYQGYTQIKAGQSHPPYGSDPPTSGWFIEDISPGYYHVPVPVENAMGIAAKGGVIVWTSQKESRDVRAFYTFARRNDIIGVLDPKASSGVVFVAWGVMVRCERFSGEMLVRFIERYSKGKALVFAEPDAKVRI